MTERDAMPEPDDPYAREAQIFPRLTPEMAARVAGYGTEELVPEGTLLIERGQRSVDFFLLLEGRIEIFDTGEDGTPNVLAVHTERQFTGELDLFNDRMVLINARAAQASRVVRVPHAQFRRMVSTESDLGEILMRAFILRRVGFITHARAGVVLLGPGHAASTLSLQRFLTRNGYPYRLLDTEAEADVPAFLHTFQVALEELPVVLLGGGRVLRNPTPAALADELGLTETLDPSQVYDVAIVGAGPAGLAAAVYSASEGLDTLVIEGNAPGGQAGTSSKIENYLGFPTGISGQALAGRAQIQAQKFGARLAISRGVTKLDCSVHPFRLELEGGQSVQAASVIVATGARYNTLDVPDYNRFEGQGLHYAATAMEAHLCSGEEVIVVGGGNSAGQAAVFMSRTAAHVHVLVRREGLAATMSDYLVQRIMQSPRITLHAYTEIVALEGDERLRHVTWKNRKTEARERHAIGNVFVMIGATPNTGWLDGCLELDPAGFVKTGTAADGTRLESPYATAKPGLFAIGDVRSGSVKRVASGVGEGSVVVQAVHRYLHPDVR